MFGTNELRPRLSPEDIERLGQSFRLVENPEEGITFPSGTLIVADPNDLGYTDEVRSMIEGVQENPGLRQPFNNNWERIAFLRHGFIFFPGADCGFFVSQHDSTIRLVNSEYNDQSSADFRKARFEVCTESATLLVGDLGAFSGNLSYSLPAQNWWPNSHMPKVPSTAYGQALHVDPSARYALSARLRIGLIRDFTLQPIK